MKKIYWTLLLLLLIPINVFAGGNKDDSTKTIQKGVQCHYHLTNPEDEKNLMDFNVKIIDYTDGTHSMFCKYGNDTEGNCNGAIASHSVNGRFIYFGYEDYFYSTYNDNGGVCPETYTSLNVSEQTYYIKLVVGSGDTIYSSSKPYMKTTSTDGVTWTQPSSKSEDKITTLNTCTYNFGTDIGLSTTKYHYNITMELTKTHNETKNTYHYNLTLKDPDQNKSLTFKNIQNQGLKGGWVNTFPAPTKPSGNEVNIFVSEQSFKDMIDNGCISKDKVGAYFDVTATDNWRIVVTTDQEELADAAENGENTYNGDSKIENEYTYPATKFNGDLNLNTGKGCTSYLGDAETPGQPAYYLQFVFDLMKYAAIILLFVLTIIDFAKATATSDNDAIKKAIGKAVKRLIIAVVIFLLPILIKFLFQLLGIYSSETCTLK